MSLVELRDAKVDDLTAENSVERYKSVAYEYLYDCLGTMEDEKIKEWREDVGTLGQRQWDKFTWQMPAKETDQCWWITNASEEDRSQPPRLLCNSLATLRLQLQHMRIADSGRIREEYQTRLDTNAAAVDVLLAHLDVWQHIGGQPHPDDLREPTDAALVLAKETAINLSKYREAHEDSHDGLGIFCDACHKAVDSVKSLDWETIRRDKYSLTPESIFNELARNAENLIRRHKAEQKRREAELNEAGEEDAEEPDDVQQIDVDGDKFGLNLDKFQQKMNKRCYHWSRAVRFANLVHLDEIRRVEFLSAVIMRARCWTSAHVARAMSAGRCWKFIMKI